MDYIFLNLKRFDIRPEHGGVNSLAPMASWGNAIAGSILDGLKRRAELHGRCTFAAFFPEAHLLTAAQVLTPGSHLALGCQSVHHADTARGGNFGAFTSLRTANAASELGCTWTIIGHSEERRYLAELMTLSGAAPDGVARAVGQILNREIACALGAGLRVVYCIGETAEELPRRLDVLKRQIDEGLAGVVASGREAGDIVLAYEPVWAIGPGKTPPAAEEIASIAAAIKALAPLPLVYGGGLKKENAESIGGIAALDGGLIALTRFTGAIGFHPDEYLEIVDSYWSGRTMKGGKP